ncbi:hypothetical protein [Candidatus Neptunochlamydia vexilliferae]|uniref:hypothetical protein n=1 Tax=Candidatus Neptunichlamydia vexilliferae TaxID=1651774 RepID=UPI001891183E|nr:hypothetical protein [Candidatus Neptunochlamydia vexilliferae]
MTSSKEAQVEVIESSSKENLAELAKKGALIDQIEAIWDKLLEEKLDAILAAPEFKKEGFNSLIKHVKDNAPEGEEKTSLLEHLVFLKNNSQRLIQFLDPGKKGIEKFRQSGHMIDQKLKYEFPKKNQITIFDMIQSKPIKSKIEKHGFEVKSVGVRLTAPEDKLLNALQTLLHQKSQNLNPHDPDYYKGNVEPTLVIFGKEKKESPRIRIRPGELYKTYLGNANYSGKDIKFVRETLMNLSAKKFLMLFDRKRQVTEKGKTKILTDRIEEYQSLIQVIKYTEGIEEKDLKKMSDNTSIFDSKGELIIGFNPILVEQINTKYVEYPTNINKRMVIAAGGHRLVTEAMNILRDYLMRELASKRTTVEINEERLPHVLKLTKYLQSRQKKRVAQRISDAIQTVTNLGLLASFEYVEGREGQMKYIFHINPDFQ